MHAVILAGGAGTRLRPLTYARRKELVPLLNRPLIEYRLANLREHGVSDVVFAVAKGAGEIEQHIGDGSAFGVRVSYSYEERPLGSGRAVKDAARAAGVSATLVVCNGDILTNVDLSAMIERHRAAGATLSISLAAVDDPWHFGVVEIDNDLRISRFVEKPPQGEEPSNLINAGTWLWEPAMLDRIPDDDSAIVDGFSERVLFPGIIADGLVVQGFTEDLWVDVGAPDRYLRASRLLLERMSRQLEAGVIMQEGSFIGAGARVEGLVCLGRDARVESSGCIEGPTVIGHGTTIASGAEVYESVVWEHTKIGSGARVTGSIIGGNCTIGANAVLEDAIIADGARVPDNTTLPPGATLMPNETAAA